MKSIKEKSNEYARDYLFSPLPQRAPNVHFEAGANYVLTEILDKTSKCITIKDAYEAFLECVEQLKK